MDITYTQHGDYFLPDLALPEQEDVFIGKYGLLRRTYLKVHRKVLYTNLLTSGKMHEYLAEIDCQAKDMLNLLMKQMAEAQGITEKLKSTDQMAWVGAINNIKACAEEIVLAEIVYA